MKQTPLKPGKPLERKSPLQRGAGPQRKSTPKRTQPKRIWTKARLKVALEGACRLAAQGGCDGPLEAAHVLSRAHDRYGTSPLPYLAVPDWTVAPQRIVPLCRRHHRAYDAHEIDVLPALDFVEQVQAVWDAGGIENARVRTCPTLYRSER